MSLHCPPESVSMDETILRKAVMDEITDKRERHICQEEGIHFREVLELRLEYKRIKEIENLRDFTSLARLDLNNNFIQKIQGLEQLIHLTWLNLSFNRIKKIEGLESLQKLNMLSLANNQISVIENLGTLENLTHFYLANNLLGQLDHVLCLRKFKKLHTISLFGNPISKEEDYKYFIFAFFPHFKRIDHQPLDEKTKNEASEKYQFAVEKLKLEELQIQEADEAQQRQEAELQLQKDAFVEFLDGSHLFKSMFKDDPKAETLHCIPEVACLLQTFEHQMVELCMKVFETGMAEHKRRQTELDLFLSGQNEAVDYYKGKASQVLASFDQQHQERTAELQQVSDPELLEVKINYCNKEIDQLCKDLMMLDSLLVKQLENNIKTLDVSISDMVEHFGKTAQEIFVHCRDLEDNYDQKVREVAVAIVDKVAKGNQEEDMPDDVIMLFLDKDTVMDALATGHDNHILRINDRETQLITRLHAWKVTLIKELQDKELERSHVRILDTHRYGDYLREQLQYKQCKRY